MYVSENYPFNGLGMNLGNLPRLTNAQTRSISPENFTGATGQGVMISYWEMPFRQSAYFTLTNLSNEDITCYYQVDYTLTDVPDDIAYFHAEWRRSNLLPYQH
jgi:hypothetical protein